MKQRKLRRKYDTDLEDDRISALPDSVLGFILSFLPTKEAVATTVLSRRWKSVWVAVQNLDFYHDGRFRMLNEGETMRFVRFVKRVLLLHDSGLLNQFSLAWLFGWISSHVSSWINTAITKHVHELSLFLGTHVRQFEMPVTVFSCDSLKSLELHGDISVSAAGLTICLPRLESLKLDGVEFESEEALEKLISGCVMLNYLHLHMHHGVGFTCIISSASLRRLEILFGDRCSLKLNHASSLEYLVVSGWISEISVQTSLSSLVEADLNIIYAEISNNSVVEALRAFDRAKALSLSGYVMGALTCATIKLSTEFKRLVKLKTETFSCNCVSLQDLIQNSDSLEVLTVSPSTFELLLVGSHDDHSEWTTPTEVPRCFSNTLKKVVIDGYSGSYDEREMIRYILTHGGALEIMKISCASSIEDNKKLTLLQEIREFPRKSTACEVELS